MSEPEDDLFAAEEPVHLQQLKAIAAALQAAKKQSDSVTWVPETIPNFTHDAVKKCLEASTGTSDNQLTVITSQDAAGAAEFFDDIDHSSTAYPSSHTAAEAEPTNTAAAASLWSRRPLAHTLQAADQQQSPSDSSQCQAAGTAASPAGPAVVLGSKHWRSGGSSYKPVDWVVTTCLVPDGMPTAAAADEGGGLAALEVVCRVLVLQNCQPAAATTGLTQALKRVRWQEFGLSYKDFYTSTAADDLTGLLTLGVLPDAVVTPLVMIVCSCVSIMPLAGLADRTPAPASSQPDAGAVGSSQLSGHTPSTAEPPAPYSATDDSRNNPRKRKRGSDPQNATGFGSTKRRKGSKHSEASMQLPKLSTKREKDMYVTAFEAALTALKQQLPVGYLQGKLEALLTACLPSVSGSLANILMRVSNPRLREDACSKLNCQPLQLQQHLLIRLQSATVDAIAAKSQLAASQRQQQQQRERRTGSSAAAAAAALTAGAGDGVPCEGADGGHDDQQQQQQLWLPDGHLIQDSHADGLQQQPAHQWQQLHEQQQKGTLWESDWPTPDQQVAEGRGGTYMCPAAVQWADVEDVHQQQQTHKQQHERGSTLLPGWQQQQQQLEEADGNPWQQEQQASWQQQQQQQMLADQQQWRSAVWQQQDLTGPAAAQAALQPDYVSSQWNTAVADRLSTALDVPGPRVAHEAGSAVHTKQTIPDHLTSDCIAAEEHTARGWGARKRKRYSGSAAADLF